METDCISVVIPVYKVEKYIRRCVDSVINQTHKNLEIIIVDDGSPDYCPRICDEYEKSDERIRVIHKVNGGLASARNAGMNIARGKYLFFLDSDDWLEEDGLEILYNAILHYKVDFVRYRAIRTGWPGLASDAPCRVEPVRELEEGYYNREKILNEIYPRLLATSKLTMGAIVGAWGSLYDMEFINRYQLRFYEEVRFSEDLIFSANVVKHANAFYFIDRPCVYHYFYNSNSISKSFREGRWDSCKSLIFFCDNDFKNDYDYDFENELYYLRWFCIMLALNERKHLSSINEKVRYCRKILSDPIIKNTKLRFDIMDVSWKTKLQMFMIKHGLAWMIARL